MTAIRWPALLLALLMLFACSDPPLQRRQFLQFGTLIDISLAGVDEQRAAAAFDAIEALLEQRNHQWHGWQDGDLKRFNEALARQPAEGVPIPLSLRRLIEDSKYYYRLSGGRFNPAIGKLIAAWGFHDRSQPDWQEIQRLRARLPTMDDLRIEGDRAWSANPDLQLDFGAIAKGLAVAQAAELLQARGIDNFIVNAGGDLLVQGRKTKGSPWVIGIEDPFQGGALATLKMEQPGAVFTSGSYRRFYIDENGRRRQHIIDPRSGEPAQGLRAVSVLHKDPVAADAAATALMLTATAELPAMMQRFGLRQVLVIAEDGKAWATPGWIGQLHWRKDADIHPQPLRIDAQHRNSGK